MCRILDDSFSHNDGPVITVVQGSPSPTTYPITMLSPGSPSSSSSAHNMTEEEGQMDNRYSTRRSNANSKLSKGSSSVTSTSNTSAGQGVWDIFRERFSRTRRPHSAERSDHPHPEGGNQQSDSGTSSSQSTNAEREAAAIAVLENVIDSCNAARSSQANSGKEPNTVINQVNNISWIGIFQKKKKNYIYIYIIRY